MAECLKDIGKGIITQCLWPPIKIHIDYWWCFDNNIQVLKDGVRDLDRETFDINQKIEQARLRTDKRRPGVEEWSKAGTEKLEEAKTILQDDINPKAWNLISRYSMGKRAKKAAEEIAKHLKDGNFNLVADPAPPPAMRFTPDRSIMYFQSRKHIEEDIINTLKESSVSMIGICGMGGVGKTTMAQRIRERVMEEKEEEKLFDEVVMIVVSQPIDMLKIQEAIADLLDLEFDKRSMAARADKLRKRLMDNKRKIVIFDDVWERFKLEDLGVPSGFEGCKIILTTRSEDVCKNMKVQKIVPIEILTEEEARILFKRIAGDCVEDSVLHSVVAECKGLPLALVTVGMAMQNKEKSNWDDALLQLKRANPTALTEVRINVYNHLKLSYDHLDNDCERFLFLLCCLFPEDYNIRVEELTLYFMGLRIFDDDDITCIQEARNRIRTLVGNLKSRFLLIDGGGKHHVKMHDVVRDVAIFIGSKEKNRFLKSLNQISIGNSSDINCEWMSVDVSNELMNVDMILHFPKLRVLMLLGLNSDIYSEEIGDLNVSLEGITDLNVMSFSKVRIGSLPPTLASLQNLKTLYLDSCKVEDISVIGELGGLEILYCHDCYEIKELPLEIGRLNRLRLLVLNGCYNIQRIAFGILSRLIRLEELKMLGSFDKWGAEENGEEEKRNASVRELESLPNLTCLEIQISDPNLTAQQIWCLPPKLVKYYICIGPVDYWRGEIYDYEKAMKLKLPSDIGAVGKWIQNLVKNTEYLFLQGDGSNNINLEQCQDLRYLRVENCSTLKKVVQTKDCKSAIVFPMLERLYLYKVENIEEIWDGTLIRNQNVSSLSNLKYVVTRECSKLRYLFSVSVATSLLQLEELEVESCSAMEQVFRNDITDDGCIQFPKLKKLRLDNLPNLKKVVKRKDCKSGIVFPMLEILHLILLDNLEEIWDGTIILNQNNASSSLSNLKNIYIDNCSKLRYLFSVSVATTCLLQLEAIKIERCSKMEQVFRNDITDHGCIEFPKLKELMLENLPNLTAFCQGFENIKFPNLTELWIRKLPKLDLNSETGNDHTNSFHLLCNPKFLQVEIGGLKTLVVQENFNYNNIRNICFFSYLKELVISEINGIRSLMSYSIAINLVSLKDLQFRDCEDMVEVIEGNDDDKQAVDIKCLFPTLKKMVFGNLPKLRRFWQWNHTLELPLLNNVNIYDCPVMETFILGSLNTPNLKELVLDNLPDLTAFCQGIENIKFPNLTEMRIRKLPRLNSLCPLNSEARHDHTNPFHFFCNPKVEFGGLKDLRIDSFNYNNMRNIWCHQTPINFFNNLQELRIYFMHSVRSLMSYSIAKNLVSLKYLQIGYWSEMVEVIEGNDDDKQVVDNKYLLPTLKTLEFEELPKLKRFWQWNHALELPLLEKVIIDNCPVMETFTLGSLNTPNLKRLMIDWKEPDEMKDLNDFLHHHFRTKSQNTSIIKVEEEEEEEETFYQRKSNRNVVL